MPAKTAQRPNQNKKDMTNIKWVKKARMWCKTVILNGKQKQEWSENDPRTD